MKIGFNVKKIYENVMLYIENMTNSLGITLLQYGENINKNTNNISSLNNRVSTLENKVLTLENSLSGGNSKGVENK